ncbi:macrocin O-methyltransferase [Oceanispirochaeta crateris]|uniref:Macrocin O-methyltransferase n=1 Tax=Oceanispirochaeta crateris TaxID=2518645 RepID=A0A5C1QL56_9SPIO|nr:TylF/MycF/NovP-related O-methyltransferase [Oceanispirochaeta crateris]QEN07949.1 macrocin O-methyltransferase [Oceanispirochaeta crateris]
MKEHNPISKTFSSQKEMADYLSLQGWGCESPATFRIDMEEEFLKIWELVSPYTMISMERAYALYSGIKHLLTRRIEGDFVECGVWKGGSCMLMAMTLLSQKAEPRPIWLYDTFAGMTEPGEEDRIASTGEPVSERWHEGWWAAGTAMVEQHLSLTGYPMDLFHIVQGDVCETLNSQAPDKPALLRLDTDWYASTKKELEVLYPRLCKGGLLIIDDYGHFSGSRQAVDEYFSESSVPPFFQRSDYTGRCAVKEESSSVKG